MFVISLSEFIVDYFPEEGLLDEVDHLNRLLEDRDIVAAGLKECIQESKERVIGDEERLDELVLVLGGIAQELQARDTLFSVVLEVHERLVQKIQNCLEDPAPN